MKSKGEHGYQEDFKRLRSGCFQLAVVIGDCIWPFLICCNDGSFCIRQPDDPYDLLSNPFNTSTCKRAWDCGMMQVLLSLHALDQHA